jgi:hypothetical protein
VEAEGEGKDYHRPEEGQHTTRRQVDDEDIVQEKAAQHPKHEGGQPGDPAPGRARDQVEPQAQRDGQACQVEKGGEPGQDRDHSRSASPSRTKSQGQRKATAHPTAA